MSNTNPLTLLSNASNLRAQSSSLYYNQYTDCSFVFEFLPMDVTAAFTTTAQFEQIIANAGLSPVDSVATLNVTAANFSRLFYIKTNDLDNLNNANDPTNNMSYGVIGNAALGVTNGVNPFTNISYSNANIHSGFANPALSYVGNTSLYQDYVRYTAKAITGGYALSDIFSNEYELLTGVGKMDPSFNASFGTLLNNSSNCENISNNISTSVPGYQYVLSCKTLVDNLLNDAVNVNGNTSSYLRGQKFLSDLRAQSDAYSAQQDTQGNVLYNISFNGVSDATYWVIFQPGDVMAVRLTYSPQNGSGNPAKNGANNLGVNPLYNRSYKIYLRMT